MKSSLSSHYLEFSQHRKEAVLKASYTVDMREDFLHEFDMRRSFQPDLQCVCVYRQGAFLPDVVVAVYLPAWYGCESKTGGKCRSINLYIGGD